jgi:hypothetical protein
MKPSACTIAACILAALLASACAPSSLIQSQDGYQSVTLSQSLKYQDRWTKASMDAYHQSHTRVHLKIFALETIPFALDKATKATKETKACDSLHLTAIKELPKKVTLKYLVDSKEMESPPWSARDQWDVDACGALLSFEVFDSRHGYHVRPMLPGRQ